MRTANQSAEWLTEQHGAGLSPLALREFYIERRNEILLLDWNPDYWHELTLWRDETERGYASCSPSNDPVPPAYDDPDRKPSNCDYSSATDRYPTPTGQGTTEEPAPGWYGEVIDGRFEDLWHAQRYLVFDAPESIQADSERPLLSETDITIHAEASDRGNRVWFTPTTWARLTSWGGNYSGIIYHWAPISTHRFKLPPENPTGWSHSETIREAFNLRNVDQSPDWLSASRIHMKQITAPARGKYFSGNDWVRVRWQGSIRVFYAKAA